MNGDMDGWMALIGQMVETSPGFIEDVFEMFKRLFMEWLKFFRDNMLCPCAMCLNEECPYTCQLDCDGCQEIDRVWELWLSTLTAEDKAAVN